MKKEKTIKAHSRKTKSGKTVQVKQHSAKYDSADDMAKKAILAREGAGKEFKRKKDNIFNNDLLDDLLQSDEVSEYHKVWDELEMGLNEEREIGTPVSTGKYKKLEKKMQSIKDLIDKKYGKGAGEYLENNIDDHVTYNKDGSSSLRVKPSKTSKTSKTSTTSTTKTSTPPISTSDFKAWYHWDMDNDPKNEGALRAEKQLKKKLGTKGYKEFFNKATDSYSTRGHNKAFKEVCSEKGSKEDTKTSKVDAKPAKVKKPDTSKTEKSKAPKVDTKAKPTKVSPKKSPTKGASKKYSSKNRPKTGKPFDDFN